MKRISFGALAKRHRLALTLGGIVAACAVILPACGGGGDAGLAGPSTMAIVVTSSPPAGTVQDGTTRQYAIEVRDQNSVVLSSFTTATWSVIGAPGIATIATAGLATCVTVGSVTIHAVGPIDPSGANLTADATLQCVAPASVPTSMSIVVTSSPTTGTVLTGTTRQYAIVVRDQYSAVLTSYTTAAWSILGTGGIATISALGLATCITAGNVTVQAIGPANGSGTNLAADLALQCVTPPPAVATVVVSPPSANCLVGATMQFTAKAFDGSGVEVVGAVSSWLTDASSVGTVNNAGLVTCNAAGTTKVRAFAGSGSNPPGGSADLTVMASTAIASIHVSVYHAFLTVGAVGSPTIQLSATAFNVAGVQISPVNFVWGTSNASVAPVSVGGLVTGNVSGGALVTASSGGKTGTAAITVGNFGAIFAQQVNANGGPAEGAILTAYQGSTVAGTGITSYSGRGYIPGLAAGTYTVTVALTGYVTQTFTGVVVTATNATALPPNPITMSQ